MQPMQMKNMIENRCFCMGLLLLSQYTNIICEQEANKKILHLQFHSLPAWVVQVNFVNNATLQLYSL